MSEVWVNTGCEVTQADEKQTERQLDEEWEHSSNLVHLPDLHSLAAEMADPHATLCRRRLVGGVSTKPLFDEDTDGSRGQAEDETREPEDVHA